MARLFTNDGSLNDAVTVTAQGYTAWPYGTMAAVVYQTNSSATDAYNVVVCGTSAQDFVELYSRESTHLVQLWNGTADFGGTTAITLNEWMLIAATKTTGTTTPRAHLFRWSTGTWTHENMGGTLADAAGTGATEHGIGFSGAGNGAFSFFGHVLAAAAWASRAMSDSEIERLASGLWDRWTPSLLMEFPSGRDAPAKTTIDQSRNRMRQNFSGSQVTRSNIVGPAGFRMSALNRRR